MADSHRDEIARLEALYAANPGGRVFVHLAEAYRKAGEHERARRILEEGLDRHPDSASGFVVLGRVLADVQADDEAEVAFRKVLTLDGGNLVALRWLGDLARQAGRSHEAVARYRELLVRNPSNEEVRELVEIVEREAGAEAEEESVEAVFLDADDELAYEEAMPGLEEPAAAGPADDAPWSAAPGSTGDAEPSPAEHGLIEIEPEAVEDSAAAYGAEPEPEPVEEPYTAAYGAEPEPEAVEEAPLEIVSSLPFDDEDESIEIDGDVDTLELNMLSGSGLDDQEREEREELDLEEDEGGELDLLYADELESVPPGAEPDAVEAEYADESFVRDLMDMGAEPGSTGSSFTGSVADLALVGEEQGDEADAGELAEPEPEPDQDSHMAPAAEAGLMTETMAELYRSQGFHARAAGVYRALLRQRPGDERLAARLREAEAATRPADPEEDESGEVWLRGVGTAWTGADAAVEEATPYAWTTERDDTEQGEPISAYLRELVAWRPDRRAWADAPRTPDPDDAVAATGPEPAGPWIESSAPPRETEAELGAAEAEADLGGADTAVPEPGPDLVSGPRETAEPWADAEPEPWSPQAEPWAFAAESAEPRDAAADEEPWSAAPVDESTTAGEPAPPAITPLPDEAEHGSTVQPEEPADPWLQAPAEPATADSGEEPAYWTPFDLEETPGRPTAEAPAQEGAEPPGPATPMAEEESEDEDLEVFRSWLQSLKK